MLESAGDRPVVFRTVDIGGDKALPYLIDETAEQAENPAMGWRAIRLSLDRDDADEGAGPRPDRRVGGQGAAGHVPDDLRAVGI